MDRTSWDVTLHIRERGGGGGPLWRAPWLLEENDRQDGVSSKMPHRKHASDQRRRFWLREAR